MGGLFDQARNTFLSGGGRHALHIDLPPDLPRVMADSQRIVQVLNNLLSNASRHSPESSPIRVSALRDGVHVAISVSDEGPGVPPDQLPLLFQKHTGFASGDPKRRAGGFGLGLVICKGLVEAHAGRIWAESGGPGGGTRFTFTVPLADEAGAGRRPESHPLASGGQERTRILVLDDDPQMLRYVRDALAAAGYAPLVTGDPRELSHLVQTKQPQLVLLDLMLPGTDGIELMQCIPELADLPVIFISGYGRDETIARALEIGATDYIVKPFSATELTARVRAALRRHGEPEPFRLGTLTIYYEQRRVTMAGRVVHLTATEYELLRVLSLNRERSSRTTRCCGRCGAGGTPVTRSWCAPSSKGSAGSWATTRRSRRTSSPSAGSATAWPDRTTRDGIEVPRQPPRFCSCTRPAASAKVGTPSARRLSASGVAWGISQRIQQMSDMLLQVNQGSLYPALHRLERQGLLDTYWGTSENNRQAKYYQLTATGRRRLDAETEQWSRMSTAIARVLETT